MVNPPGIEGVRLFDLTAHVDDRGSLTETFRRSWVEGAREVVQANLSRSRAGVMRGLHFHRRQADLWCVVAGRAFVALVDLRRGSPTEGRTFEVVLDPSVRDAALYIPPGVAHGFYAQTDVVLQYLVDAYYDGSDEHGVAWDDPALGIAWPTTTPILSDRDRANPRLADARLLAPTFGEVAG